MNSIVRRSWVMSASAILAVLALLVLAAGAIMARNGGAMLPFRWVDVSGPFGRVSAEQIRAAVAPATSGGFFTTDIAEVRARVMALPWVADAEVRKHWPDTLEVRVTERQVLGHQGESQLIDVTGAVFQARGAGETRGLPHLEANPEQMVALAEHYRRAQHDLEGMGRSITGARLSPRGALEFQLSDGLTVQLGSRDLSERWRRFVLSLPSLTTLDRRPIALADLRYTHGFAIRYAEPQPANPAAPDATSEAQP